METINLDIYGHEPIPWSRALTQLETQNPGENRTCWLATTSTDGNPHVAAVGGLWADDRFYVTSGPGTRKSRNLERNPNCVISVSLGDIDVVLQGTARKVTDQSTLERIVKMYNELGWPARVADGAFTAEFSAPSAGPPPWYLYEFTPSAAVGVATAEPHGATRWRFG